MHYVIESAPLISPEEFAIAMAIADGTDYVGSGCRKSQSTIAKEARCSDRTVRRKLTDLETAGIIRRGDQRLVAHLKPDERPVVWDLVIPYSWFRDIARTNGQLAADGRPPLTCEDRPDLPARQPRARRADHGKKKAKKGQPEQQPEPSPGLEVRPPDDTENSDVSPGLEVRPDLKSRGAGLEVQTARTSSPTTYGFDPGYDPYLLSPETPQPGMGLEEGKEEEILSEDQHPTAAAKRVLAEVLRKTPVRRHPTGWKNARLITLVGERCENGWDEKSLAAALDGPAFRPTDDVYACVKWRIEHLGDFATAPASVPWPRVQSGPCPHHCTSGTINVVLAAGDKSVMCPVCNPAGSARQLARAAEKNPHIETFEQFVEHLRSLTV